MFSFVYYSQFFFCVFFLILVNSTDQINAFGIILNKFFFWLIGLGFVVSYGHVIYIPLIFLLLLFMCVFIYLFIIFKFVYFNRI
eukprot:gene5553-4007_t